MATSRYSKKEDDVFKKFYEVEGAEGLFKRMPYRSIDAIRKHAQSLHLTYKGMSNINVPKEFDVSFLLKENDKLRKSLDIESHRSGLLLKKIKEVFSKPEKKHLQSPQSRKSEGIQEVHIQRSDGHTGLEVSPSNTQLLGSYNVEIYIKRLQELQNKLYNFWNEDKNAQGLRKVVVSYLGDMVEGDGNIYPGQSYHCQMSVMEQVKQTAEAESQWIEFLASYMDEVEIFCVDGNHGKVGGKYSKSNPNDNWDSLFYYLLKMRIQHLKNVKIFISGSPSMLVQHGDFKFLYIHGDIIRGGSGIPFCGAERLAGKVSDLYNMVIDYVFSAHHHTPAQFGKVYMNGSMVGGSDLSINKMSVSGRPSQNMMYFHPKHGINRYSEIFLEERQRLEADGNGIFTGWNS